MKITRKDKLTVIKHMETARDIHIEWAKYQRALRANGKRAIPRVGGETHHRKWAKIYNDTIAILKESL